MITLFIEYPITRVSGQLESVRLQNHNVLQFTVEKAFVLARFMFALYVFAACSVDRDPISVDSGAFRDFEGSVGKDSGPSIRERQPESGAIPRPEASLPDSAGVLKPLVYDASILDRETNDTSVGDKKNTDGSHPDDAQQLNECDLPGIYSAQVAVEVWWRGQVTQESLAVIDPGRATILLNMMFIIESIESDGKIIGSTKTCHIELPPYYTTLACESYQPVFPADLSDSEANPSYLVEGSVDCSLPGCAMHFDSILALLGVVLDDPQGPWPQASQKESFSCSKGTGIDCFADHDGDQEPGITVDVLTYGFAPSVLCWLSPSGIYEYKAVPTSFDPNILNNMPVPRTDRIHLGIRAMVGGDIMIADDCGGANGQVVAEGFQSRIVGCYLQPNSPDGNAGVADENTLCTYVQQQFIDENIPLYNCMNSGDIPPADLIAIANQSPSAGPQMSLIKLGGLDDRINCEDVRNANP